VDQSGGGSQSSSKMGRRDCVEAWQLIAVVRKGREGHGGSHHLLQWIVGRWSLSDYDGQRWQPVVLDGVAHNTMRREMRCEEDVEA
jgi:hypothetical protein